MERYGIIYKITNKVNGKVYIGQTIQSLAARWRGHCTDSLRKDMAIGNSIRKYGSEQFIIEAVCSCFDKNGLDDMERYFVSLYQSHKPLGYNIREAGSKGRVSEETKRKLSKSHQGISTGPHSIEWCDSISRGHTSRGVSKVHPHQNKVDRPSYKRLPIIGINIATGQECFYPYVRAAEYDGFRSSHICECLKGKRKVHLGHTWKVA